MTLDFSVAKMVVCGDCGDVVGPFERPNPTNPRSALVQRGSCARHAAPPGEPRWPGFDYNRRVELCNCCGTVPLRSGSRWSVWFCDACKQQVMLLNGRHGRCVVPIGRHSIQAGLSLTRDQIVKGLDVHIFIGRWNAVADVMSLLSDWQRIVVRRNLKVIRTAEGSAVPAPDYCAKMKVLVDPMDRFREMCAYLDRRAREALNNGGGSA